MQWHNAEFVLTDDRSTLDVSYIHAFLTNSYWAQGIPLETVIRSLLPEASKLEGGIVWLS